MVSRREKLKLLQSKAQEQLFNLHMKLMDQEYSAGEPQSILANVTFYSFYFFLVFLILIQCVFLYVKVFNLHFQWRIHCFVPLLGLH